MPDYRKQIPIQLKHSLEKTFQFHFDNHFNKALDNNVLPDRADYDATQEAIGHMQNLKDKKSAGFIEFERENREHMKGGDFEEHLDTFIYDKSRDKKRSVAG